MAADEQGRGVWPVMLTPFQADGAIDWAALDELTEWYLDAGVAGLFSVAQSSEMYNLTEAERLAVATRVVRLTAGRVPVVAAGTFGGPIEEQAGFVRRMADTGVSGVVVLTCQLAAAEEADDVWRANAERLLAATGEVELGLYECPQPYKRLLSPELIGWAARTGRFRFHKDTSCMTEPIRAKIAAVRGTPFRFYNANTATLLGSLQAGGHGYSGIAANYFPELYVWLCREFERQPERALRLQRFLGVADRLVSHKYPRSAKIFLATRGLRLGPTCRVGNPEFVEEELLALKQLRDYAQELAQELGATGGG